MNQKYVERRMKELVDYLQEQPDTDFNRGQLRMIQQMEDIIGTPSFAPIDPIKPMNTYESTEWCDPAWRAQYR